MEYNYNVFFKEKYKNYVMYGGLNKMDKLKKALPFIFPPLAVLLIMGLLLSAWLTRSVTALYHGVICHSR